MLGFAVVICDCCTTVRLNIVVYVVPRQHVYIFNVWMNSQCLIQILLNTSLGNLFSLCLQKQT
jgi:hypothetical protein